MTAIDEIQGVCESAVSETRFNMNSVYSKLLQTSPETCHLLHLDQLRNLYQSRTDKVIKGVIRASLFIELVKEPKIETTKFEVRWANRLGQEDPRFATPESCIDILEKLATDLVSLSDDQSRKEIIELMLSRSLLPYEVPIDYVERIRDGFMHSAENMFWINDELVAKTVRLRVRTKDICPLA
ncbi:MAG: hypothetical protein ACYDET_04570 [Thermoleophilia bacterium]